MVMCMLKPMWCIHENVVGFDTSILDEVLGKVFRLWHLKVSPGDFGWSVCSRPRILTLCLRRDVEAVSDPAVLYQKICDYCKARHSPLEIPDLYGFADEPVLLATENAKRSFRGLPAVTRRNLEFSSGVFFSPAIG